MHRENTTRVLVVADEFVSAQIALYEAQTCKGYKFLRIRSREDFFREIDGEDVQVAFVQLAGLEDLPLPEVLQAVGNVPVVVLGDEGDSDAIQYIEDGASDYVPISQLERLPPILRRLKRERESFARQQDMEIDLRQAYEGLVENQKLMAIGRLAGMIAHEINNPLESITNLLYLLRSEEPLTDSARSYIDLAEREMGRVAQISKQTLNFYRDTRIPVRIKPSELLEEILVLYARRIEERQMAVVRQFKTERSLVVFPGEVRQVFSNLIANAIEASPIGGTLTLRVRDARMWSDEGIQGIRIVVADNGSGISPEVRQHLGKLFYTTKGQRGTGLGLWVTRAIVDRYGGEMRLFSSTREDRHGTAFSIFMPTNLRPRAVSAESGSEGLRESGASSGQQRSAQGSQRTVGISSYGPNSIKPREFKRRARPLAAS